MDKPVVKIKDGAGRHALSHRWRLLSTAMLSRIVAASAVSLVMLAPCDARADAQSDFATVIRNFHAVKSFHSEMDNEKGQKLVIDYAAPDRYRTLLPDGTETIMIGSAVWMKLNGQYMKVPAAAGAKTTSMDQFSLLGGSSDEFAKHYDIIDTGPESLGGAATHTYRIIQHGTTVPMKVWVGTESLPLQLTVTTNQGSGTVRYSKFNAPLTIAAP